MLKRSEETLVSERCEIWVNSLAEAVKNEEIKVILSFFSKYSFGCTNMKECNYIITYFKDQLNDFLDK